jgi:hypothetical protein
VSDIEEIYGAVKARSGVFKQPDPCEVTSGLPQEKITEGLAEHTSAKIKRYCHFKIEESQQALKTLRLQGLDSVRVVIFLPLPCLVLGVLYAWVTQTGINAVLQAVFIVAAAIFFLSAGWVAL